jgi:hypothetical protein
MTRRLVGRLVLPVLMLAFAVSSSDAQKRGRYKKQGDSCVWDVNDTGPNQCTPWTPGHFRKTGKTCVWDANGFGADQCRPNGRFKVDGDKCLWTPNDNGPDQCDPRKPR